MYVTSCLFAEQAATLTVGVMPAQAAQRLVLPEGQCHRNLKDRTFRFTAAKTGDWGDSGAQGHERETVFISTNRLS